ncbi:MAG: V-type ATP synthase subunit I, partial [Thermoplasmatota archaeon]
KRTTGNDSDLGLSILHLVRSLENVEEGIKKMKEKALEKASELAPKLLDLARSWKEAVEIEMEKKRVRGSLRTTRYTNVISGWVEKDRLEEVRKLISGETMGRYHMECRDPSTEEVEENMVPTKLQNGRFASLFEPLTLTFSVPKYNEIDPSLWISVPFVLFFGLMLGDAGYGLLILLPSIYIYLKGKRSQTLRSVGALGILMGLATTISGIWMGALFGDLIPRLIYNTPGEPLYEMTLFGYNMPYDTLKDPMVLFQISLWLGLAQLDLGILLLGYDRLRKKNVWGFFKGSISWILIQIGAVIFIGALLIGWWDLDTPLLVIGASTFLSGSFLLAFEGGFMFLFDIEGLLGDWISYTRILALGLSTFGLAMAFNIVGEMLVDLTPVLIPVVIIMLFFLHIFNLLLQTLGAAVHSIRLQFVEFFARFFEGGGELFEPFGREREFTRLPPDAGRGGVLR